MRMVLHIILVVPFLSLFVHLVVNCLEGMFLCISEDRCIARSLRCDGIPDCANGIDEQSCEGISE